MKLFLLLLMFLLCHQSFSQVDSATLYKEIAEFQQTLDKEYKDEKESPLESKERRKFKGHDFFAIDLKYRIEGRFIKAEKDSIFKMPTTTDRLPEYAKYGVVYFTLDGQEIKLNVYQSLSLKEKPGFKDYLFLPFKDTTNGSTSYSGGRFLDLRIPTGDTIIIDFNKAYNPYCAYNHKYSCPIPPKENHLTLEINAGVKMDNKEH